MIDENEGLGGSYTLNPKTGKRTLVERTKPAEQTDKPADEAGFFSPAESAETTQPKE